MRVIHGLCQLLPASETLLGIMSDARATAINSSFPGNSYFRKDFKVLFAVKEGDVQNPNRELGQI